MNICVLFLDNEKRSLRDTGREKSKQLERERENGKGSPASSQSNTELFGRD